MTKFLLLFLIVSSHFVCANLNYVDYQLKKGKTVLLCKKYIGKLDVRNSLNWADLIDLLNENSIHVLGSMFNDTSHDLNIRLFIENSQTLRRQVVLKSEEGEEVVFETNFTFERESYVSFNDFPVSDKQFDKVKGVADIYSVNCVYGKKKSSYIGECYYMVFGEQDDIYGGYRYSDFDKYTLETTPNVVFSDAENGGVRYSKSKIETIK